MTNQQGAPEALRLAAEVLDWMPTSDTQRALWDRHQKALVVVKAALVEAQQPAPSAAVAAEAPGRTDAEIVAQTVELTKYLLSWKWGLEPEGDISRIWESKNTKAQVCWNAACHIQDLLTQTDVWNAVAELDGQPSPTPQADSAPTSGNWLSADDVNRLVRELDVALNGEAGAAAQASLCDVVAQVRLEAAKRGQPLLAPQADSTPSTVTVEHAIRIAESLGVREYGPNTRNWSFEYSQLSRFVAALTAPQADSQPAPDNLRALFREALAWGMVYGPEIPAHQWDEMRESMVKQYTSRAASARADSVTAPAESDWDMRGQLAYLLLETDGKQHPHMGAVAFQEACEAFILDHGADVLNLLSGEPTQAQAGAVPLTDDELLAMWTGGDERFMRPVLGKNKVLAFGRAVEHRIKGGQHGSNT